MAENTVIPIIASNKSNMFLLTVALWLMGSTFNLLGDGKTLYLYCHTTLDFFQKWQVSVFELLSTLGDTTQLLIAQFFRILIIGIVHTKDMYNDFKIRILH